MGDGVKRRLLGGVTPEVGLRHGAFWAEGAVHGEPRGRKRQDTCRNLPGGLPSRGMGTGQWPAFECLLTWGFDSSLDGHV